MMSHSLKLNLGVENVKEEVLSLLFPFVETLSNIDHDLMINLWQLAQDNEYVLLQAHKHSDFFPKILASCGTFYAVEYAKPISEMVTFSDSISDWALRVKYSKLVLELLNQLSNYKTDPFHIW